MQIRLSAAAGNDYWYTSSAASAINRALWTKRKLNKLPVSSNIQSKMSDICNFRPKQHQRAICQKHQLYMVSNKKSAQTLHQITTVTRYPPFSGLGFSLVINFNRGVWGGGSPPSASQLLLHTVTSVHH